MPKKKKTNAAFLKMAQAPLKPFHFQLPHLPTKEGRLPATLQLLFSASTPQALSVAELRKRFSCAITQEIRQKFGAINSNYGRLVAETGAFYT
jgi:hypothetical protein